MPSPRYYGFEVAAFIFTLSSVLCFCGGIYAGAWYFKESTPEAPTWWQVIGLFLGCAHFAAVASAVLWAQELGVNVRRIADVMERWKVSEVG